MKGKYLGGAKAIQGGENTASQHKIPLIPQSRKKAMIQIIYFDISVCKQQRRFKLMETVW